MNILITGAAGFIGFHLSLFLQARGDQVIGLDNFSPYYDVSLKRNREKELNKKGIKIIQGDIRQKDLLIDILQKENIDLIAHMAAQAGIRYSLDHPEDYVGSNLEGFVSVMESARQIPDIKVVFASSSSVYGLNKKTPFSVKDPTDHPANLYGATKKSNELIAFAYHNLFDIPMTGLRFFTVYGPWGRPDMSYFTFTKKILNNEPIDVFNHGNMKRDFTYIDDVVKGTASAIDKCSSFQIFNLGSHYPVSILEMISILEKKLGKPGRKNLLPIQAGEVQETYADISESQEELNFTPSFTLDQGLESFVLWYKDYYGIPLEL